MYTNQIQGGNALRNLARELTRAADTDRNGQLSTDEFASFLTTMLGAFTGRTGSSPNAGLGTAGLTTAADPATPPTTNGANLPFTGFNFERAQDINRSAKDAFAHLARQSGVLPRTKAEAEQWFNTHIRAGMDALGHKVEWVQGDKFKCTNWQGTGVIDFVFNADGPDPMFAWNVVEGA